MEPVRHAAPARRSRGVGIVVRALHVLMHAGNPARLALPLARWHSRMMPVHSQTMEAISNAAPPS
jgi:hypothetical protein